MNDEHLIKSVLTGARTIAVVGASPNPGRPSNQIMKYLLEQGYKVIPVRPKVTQILDQQCYESLGDIREPIDIVDVFRRAEACPDVARAAVDIGAGVLWLQEGIISEEAAAIADAGGLKVIMDRCTMKEHLRFK